MQHSPGREGKRARDQDATHIKPDHSKAMGSNISTAGGKVGDWNTKNGEQAEDMNKPKMVQEPRTHFCGHGERDESCCQHQHHVYPTEDFVAWGAFTPEQLKGAYRKCWQHGCQMQIR